MWGKMRDKNRERRRELLAIDAANIQLHRILCIQSQYILLAIDAANIQLYRIYVYSQSIYC